MSIAELADTQQMSGSTGASPGSAMQLFVREPRLTARILRSPQRPQGDIPPMLYTHRTITGSVEMLPYDSRVDA